MFFRLFLSAVLLFVVSECGCGPAFSLSSSTVSASLLESSDVLIMSPALSDSAARKLAYSSGLHANGSPSTSLLADAEGKGFSALSEGETLRKRAIVKGEAVDAVVSAVTRARDMGLSVTVVADRECRTTPERSGLQATPTTKGYKQTVFLYLTPNLLVGITLFILIAFIAITSVYLIMDIQTPDRFEQPKKE